MKDGVEADNCSGASEHLYACNNSDRVSDMSGKECKPD